MDERDLSPAYSRARRCRSPKGLILGIRLSQADIYNLLSEARDEFFASPKSMWTPGGGQSSICPRLACERTPSRGAGRTGK
jgi:hypothetical protein